jgi:hypothetical protein
MKIIGFSQLRNEIEKGNLHNWFKCMIPICDYIYIYDQKSIDGSIEFYKKFNNTTVIESKINRFDEELICKHELLEKIKHDHPDTNFIQWLDGDELIDGRLLNNSGQLFKQLCTELLSDGYEGYSYGHKNLWRSDVYERTDDNYDWLDHTGVCKLWKFSKNLWFNKTKGLHQKNYPANINKIKKLDFSLIHRGFATDFQIINKYNIYKSFGQKGWELNRLLNEQTLSVQRINNELLPEWFEVVDEINPTTKTKIRDVYNES